MEPVWLDLRRHQPRVWPWTEKEKAESEQYPGFFNQNVEIWAVTPPENHR